MNLQIILTPLAPGIEKRGAAAGSSRPDWMWGKGLGRHYSSFQVKDGAAASSSLSLSFPFCCSSEWRADICGRKQQMEAKKVVRKCEACCDIVSWWWMFEMIHKEAEACLNRSQAEKTCGVCLLLFWLYVVIWFVAHSSPVTQQHKWSLLTWIFINLRCIVLSSPVSSWFCLSCSLLLPPVKVSGIKQNKSEFTLCPLICVKASRRFQLQNQVVWNFSKRWFVQSFNLTQTVCNSVRSAA